MTLSGAMDVSASGMTAERFRMDVISSNIANSNSVESATNQPYRRREVVVEGGQEGVHVVQLVEDQSPFQVKHDPGNPRADAKGDVLESNIQPVTEMVDMMGASRAYEANVAAFNAAKGMVKNALSIGKV
jgi:flagellar basal-body rod protein FlgC